MDKYAVEVFRKARQAREQIEVSESNFDDSINEDDLIIGEDFNTLEDEGHYINEFYQDAHNG